MMCTAGTEHIEAREFQEWLATAEPGQRISYAKGALAASIHTAFQAEHPDAQKLSALQEAAWRAGAKAHVYLVQRRLKPGAFEYLAERSRGADPETRGVNNGVRI
jgi:hypothetical protein